MNREKAGAATERSIHVILFLPDTTFSIALAEVAAVSIKSGDGSELKPIWQKKKASFNLNAFSLAAWHMLAPAQGEGVQGLG